jgi:capsid protein
MTFAAAGSHPLLANFATLSEDQRWVIAAEATSLAARGTWLGCNDPFIAALFAARQQGLLGPHGPRHSSLYDPDPTQAETSQLTRATRRLISAITAGTWIGRDLDAEGVRTRRELEAAIDHAAWHTGDGIAIRVVRNGRSRWRLVHRDRVANPPGTVNGPRLRDGFTMNADGAVDGIWVLPGQFNMFQADTKRVPRWIPWTADDGTPNVIHKPGLRLPGMIRGVSELAPIIILERQVSGVLESHVAGKRLQAILSMFIEAEDDTAYKAAVDAGTAFDPATFAPDQPLMAWVVPPGTKVQFQELKFNGADLKDYLTFAYKIECATQQMPVDVVLCQMGEASLSASRAGLDQFDRTCQTLNESHIASVSSVIDRVAVADAIAYGLLTLPTDDWSAIMAGKYSRPPKYSTDRQKDANTMATLIKPVAQGGCGVSAITVYDQFGFNWEDEQELLLAQAEFIAAQQANATPSDAGQRPTPTPDASGDPAPASGDQPAAKAQPGRFARWRQLLAAFRRKDAA